MSLSKVKLKTFFTSLDWGNILLITASVLTGIFVFVIINSNAISFSTATSTASNILTVNGVFSAILITYLFTRITWAKERKLDKLNEAIQYSQKITEFRRILNILTGYYNVWTNDNATKSLFDHSKFKNVDYYDFRLVGISDYKPDNYQLIKEIFDNADYSEGQSNLYLAMISLIRPRHLEYHWQEELYKDFEQKGTYEFEYVEKWLECNIMDTIAYWMNNNYRMINFYSLRDYFDQIKNAAGRVNSKYLNYQVDNTLIRELAEDMSAHYLPNLYLTLKSLREGIQGLNYTIIALIILSLTCGVLAPLIYLLSISETYFAPSIIAVITSLNCSLITYFILKFPFMMEKELKLID